MRACCKRTRDLLYRTQRALTMDLGYVDEFTHEYIRHSPSTLSSALQTATGEVIAGIANHHRRRQHLTGRVQE